MSKKDGLPAEGAPQGDVRAVAGGVPRGKSQSLAEGILQGNTRLLAVAEMIAARTNGREVFADIGTDHAYLPIALCKAGAVGRAIAADVREGPLAIAKAHIESANLADRIEPRLSDGLSAIEPGEADVIAVCGMGGELVLAICDTNIATARAADLLVLGPQSKVFETRVGLRERGFRIIAEDLVFADGKYYPLIGVTAKGAGEDASDAGGEPESSEAFGEEAFSEVRGERGSAEAFGEKDSSEEPRLQEIFDRYGRLLLESRHPVLRQFLLKEEARLASIGERATGARRDTLQRELALCREALCMMGEMA